MKLRFTIPLVLLPFADAREQHVFNLNGPDVQRIVPPHHQPWSLLVAQNPRTGDCVVLNQPELTQTHRSIEEKGDYVVVNKTMSSSDGVEIDHDNIFEIIGFDKRILWTTTNQMCHGIEYPPSDIAETYKEYEVVCPSYNGANCRRNFIILVTPRTGLTLS